MLKFILEEKQKKNKKHMMYEVNKFSFEIKEAPNIRPLSNCYVQEMSPIRVRRKGKDTEWNYYAETKEEAEAKVAELKSAKIEKLKQEIEWHESQALYAKSRLMALISETENKQP